MSIHRKDCPNAQSANDPAMADRWVRVNWADIPSEPFSTSLEIDCSDRDGMWLDIATIMTSLKLKVTELSGRDLEGGKAIITMTFEVKSLDELNLARSRLRSLPGVTDVRRGRT